MMLLALLVRGWLLARRAVGPMKGLGLMLLVGCHAAQAEVYRWVDDQGRVHFEDRKPVKEPSKGLEEVKVRRGNVLDPVRIRQAEPAPTPEVQTQPVVLTLPGPAKKDIGVAATQAACAAKKQAYETAKACFDACGRTVGTTNWMGGVSTARNNSDCGHCTDVAMPNC